MRNESWAKSLMAVSMPDTMSASWTPAARLCACCAQPVFRSIADFDPEEQCLEDTTSAKAPGPEGLEAQRTDCARTNARVGLSTPHAGPGWRHGPSDRRAMIGNNARRAAWGCAVRMCDRTFQCRARSRPLWILRVPVRTCAVLRRCRARAAESSTAGAVRHYGAGIARPPERRKFLSVGSTVRRPVTESCSRAPRRDQPFRPWAPGAGDRPRSEGPLVQHAAIGRECLVVAHIRGRLVRRASRRPPFLNVVARRLWRARICFRSRPGLSIWS